MAFAECKASLKVLLEKNREEKKNRFIGFISSKKKGVVRPLNKLPVDMLVHC